MCRSLLVVLFGLALASPALAVPKIAVLDFQGSGLGAAPEENIKKLGQLTDVARSGAIKVVKGRYSVLTKANQDEVLAAQGFDPLACEGECEVGIMRRMQVDYGFTGNVVAVATRWRIQLDLYNVRTGVAMDTETINVEGDNPDLMLLDAMDRVSTATGAMLIRSLRLSTTSTSTIREGTIGDTGGQLDFGSTGRVKVTFSSEPEGALVLLDNELLCESTPCTKLVASGAHDLQMTKQEYHMARKSVELTSGTGSVELTLKPKFGIVDVVTVPPGLGISINGTKRAEKSPLREQRLTAGPYRILVDDPCWREKGEQILLREGERREVRIEPDQKQVGLLVDAQDEAKNQALVKVYVDGTLRGDNANFIPVSVCARHLKVEFEDGKVIEKNLTLDPTQLQNRIVISLAEEKVKETRLKVTVYPPGAEVFVDGERVGTAPITVPVRPGRHEVVARQEEYEERSESVEVAAGETGRVNLALKQKWNPLKEAGEAIDEWSFFATPTKELPLRLSPLQEQRRYQKRGSLVFGLGTAVGIDTNPYRTSAEANGRDVTFVGDLIVSPQLGIHPLSGLVDLGVDVFGDWRSFTGLDTDLPANVAMLNGTARGYLGLNRNGRAYLSVTDAATFGQRGGKVYENDGGIYPLGPWAELDQTERFRNTLVAEGGVRPGFGLSLAGGYRMVLDRWYPSQAVTDLGDVDQALDFLRYASDGSAVSFRSQSPDGAVSPGLRLEKSTAALLDSLLHEGFIDLSLRPVESFQIHARAHAGDFQNRTTPSNPVGASAGVVVLLDVARLSLDVGYEMPFVSGRPVVSELLPGVVGEARLGLTSDALDISLFARRHNATVPLYALQTVNEVGLESWLSLQDTGFMQARLAAGHLEFGREFLLRDDDPDGPKPPFPVSVPSDEGRGDFRVTGEVGVSFVVSRVLILESSAGLDWYLTNASTPALLAFEGESGGTPLGWFRGYTMVGATLLLDVFNPDDLDDFGDFFEDLF